MDFGLQLFRVCFFFQGDEEKALGRTPVPMMDRDTADKLPNHQVY